MITIRNVKTILSCYNLIYEGQAKFPDRQWICISDPKCAEVGYPVKATFHIKRSEFNIETLERKLNEVRKKFGVA